MGRRYFLYGYYGFGNFGDDLLLQALIAGIRARDPEARFLVRAKEAVPMFANDANVEFVQIEDILEKPGSRVLRFFRYVLALQAACDRCDTFVIGGGTLFIDKGRMNWSLLFLYLAARRMRRNGERVVITGVAVDVLTHPASLWLIRKLGALADFVAVRDAVSMNYFTSAATPPQLAADLAWLLPVPTPVQPPIAGKPMVVLNFIDYFRTSVNSVRDHEKYAAAIESLVVRYRDRYAFRFIAFQKDIGQRDDWFFARLAELCPDAQTAVVSSLDALADSLADASLVVTTRFHLALLAVRMGRRVAIIDHELKLTSLAQDLELPAVSMSDFIAADGADPVALPLTDTTRSASRANLFAARAQQNFGWLNA